MRISRRKFLCIGSLSALSISLSSSFTKLWGKISPNNFSTSSKFNYQPTWLYGNPHLGCSYPYFQKIDPTPEIQQLDMVHFHMEPHLRDSVIYDMPF